MNVCFIRCYRIDSQLAVVKLPLRPLSPLQRTREGESENICRGKQTESAARCSARAINHANKREKWLRNEIMKIAECFSLAHGSPSAGASVKSPFKNMHISVFVLKIY